MRVCDWLNDRHLACVCLALEGDIYCAAHRRIANGEQPVQKVKRTDQDRDADLLPYAPDEREALRDLALKTRRAR